MNTNITEVTQGMIFSTNDPSRPLVAVRDIYKLEFERFASPGRVAFYIGAITTFGCHGMWGWAKAVPAPILGIPKAHHKRVTNMGYVMVFLIVAMYVSFPIHAHWG